MGVVEPKGEDGAVGELQERERLVLERVPAGFELDFDALSRVLPHRYPFLFIDRVVSCEPGRRIVCLKNVSANENFFAGHFPTRAILPGVIIAEAMAQGALLLLGPEGKEGQDTPSDLIFLLGGVSARFLHPVVPGDQLILEVSPKKVISRAAIVEGVARVGGRIVAKARLTFAAAAGGIAGPVSNSR